ncbi:hypothetical protein CBS101457_004902 [Exobasidium rhododendri]|nr:hypothetical protein CBS101457_004902 [Exobasidium rhododendri]
MKIGIIGAGNIGQALAINFKKLGHNVCIANSRGPETLDEAAQNTGAVAVELIKVAEKADLLVITIPTKGVSTLAAKVKLLISAQTIIIDTCNYYPSRDGIIPEIDQGAMTESAWVSSVLDHGVVKVFNTLVTQSLLTGGRPKGSKTRIALPVSSDDDEAKQTVMGLMDAMGFDSVDAGPLSASWRQQPGTPCYCVDPTKKQLEHLLQRADQSKFRANRDQARKIFEKLPSDFPQEHLVRVSRLFVGLDVYCPQTYVSLARLGLALV